MFLSLLDSYRSNRWRVLLVDLALFAVMFTCIAVIRFLSVFSGDIERFQMMEAAQSGAILTEMRLQGGDVNRSLHNISVQSSVVVARLDRQVTELRILVARSQRESQKSATQEIKEVRKVLTDSMSNTADALQSAADNTPARQKPIQINVPPVPPPKTEIIIPPAADSAAPVIVQGTPAAPAKTPGFWRRLHRVLHWGG